MMLPPVVIFSKRARLQLLLVLLKLSVAGSILILTLTSITQEAFRSLPPSSQTFSFAPPFLASLLILLGPFLHAFFVTFSI